MRVATSTFRRGGALCSLCAVSPRVNQHKLGGKRIAPHPGMAAVVDLLVPELAGHMQAAGQEVWSVAPGLLEDPGHSFLAPILLPATVTGEQVLQHRETLRELVMESRELEEVPEIKEFVPVVSEKQAIKEEKEAVEALWGEEEEGEDDALLAACLDGNGNTAGKEGEGKEEKEGKEGVEGEGEHWTKRWGEGKGKSKEGEKDGGKRMREEGGEDTYGCFKCGETGHFSRECPKRKVARAPYCYKCKEAGHWDSKCPNRKQLCRKCDGEGHTAKYCSLKGDACYTCGEQGHRKAECPGGRGPKAGRYGAVAEGGQLPPSRRPGGGGGSEGGGGGNGGSSLQA